MNISEVRQKYPQYSDMSDGELARGLHQKFYSDIPYSDFLKRIDFSAPVDPTGDMSGTEKVLAGAGKAFVDVGRGVRQITGNATQAEIDEAKRLDAPLMNTGAGVTGNVIGSVAAALPAALVPWAGTLTGAAAIGAGLGATQPVATGESRAMNTGVGALGGAAGNVAGRLIGRAITPVDTQITGAQARALAGAEKLGAQATPGIRTGSLPLRQIEASAESFPLTSGAIRSVKSGNQLVLNRAAANSIGERADEVSQEVLARASSRIGSVFNTAEKIPAIPISTPVQNKLASIEMKYRGLLDKPLSEHAIVRDIYNALGKDITGVQYNDWQSQLGKIARSKLRGANSDPNFAFAMSEVKAALDDAAAAAMPKDQKAAFDLAKRQWRNLVMLEKPGVLNEQSGNVSGKVLSNTLTRQDRTGFRLGKNASDLYDMARFYRAFPDAIGDSGTATRMSLPYLMSTANISGLGGAGGAGVGYLAGDPVAGALIGAAAPLAVAGGVRAAEGAYLSPMLQRYLSNQLIDPASRNALGLFGALSGAGGALANR